MCAYASSAEAVIKAKDENALK